jgi:hypothetical protein
VEVSAFARTAHRPSIRKAHQRIVPIAHAYHVKLVYNSEHVYNDNTTSSGLAILCILQPV